MNRTASRRSCRWIAGLALAAASPLLAVETQTRVWRSLVDFAPGEMDHVSVSPEGRLVLSPEHRRLADVDEPVAWAVAVAGADLLVATGHDGRVLRAPLSGGSKPGVLLETSELEVTALAAASSGTVYAATSPDGRVYRLPPDGAEEVLFDPEERYVWALLPLPDGGLLVATGDRGAVYRVAPDRSVSVVLAAEETHVLSLALAGDGTLFAGSGGNGWVYRVAPDGATTVLLDTAGSEVKALALDEQGNLWAASTGRPIASVESGTGLGETPAPPITVTPQDDATPSGLTGSAQVPQPSPAQTPAQAAAGTAGSPLPSPLAPSGPRQSWLYRIRPDGLPEEIWRSASETVHAMALHRQRVVLGTGDEGKVFAVDPKTGEAELWLDLPGAQVTALATRGDRLILATSNLAALWAVESAAAASGTYVSPVLEAGPFATWGRLTLRGRGRLAAETRSGNTEKPGSRWSAWQDAANGVASPRGRYLQYRIRLQAAEDAPSPEVREVEMAWLPFNLPPRLRSLQVLDPHVELISSASPPAGLASAPGRSLPPTRARRPAGGEVRVAPREQDTFGARSARWEAEDPNGDALVFEVRFRAEGEERWRPLARDLGEPFVAFDQTAFADGVWQLQVTASDAPSNPEGATDTLISEPFTVDNSPPRVEVATAGERDGRPALHIELADRTTPLRWAEYSLDGGPWRPLLPDDGVFDEREETVALVLPALEPGEHGVMVRAADAARNVGSARHALRR